MIRARPRRLGDGAGFLRRYPGVQEGAGGADLAEHLTGRLLLVTGDEDEVTNPGHTLRLVDALIRADRRFDLMVFPGRGHYDIEDLPYFRRIVAEYFAEHLLGDYYRDSALIEDP